MVRQDYSYDGHSTQAQADQTNHGLLSYDMQFTTIVDVRLWLSMTLGTVDVEPGSALLVSDHHFGLCSDMYKTSWKSKHPALYFKGQACENAPGLVPATTSCSDELSLFNPEQLKSKQYLSDLMPIGLLPFCTLYHPHIRSFCLPDLDESQTR